MAVDIPRLVAAADKVLVRQLIEKIAQDRSGNVDWTLEGRELGRAVEALAAVTSPAWAKLQKINNLARHGTSGTIRSVVYHDRRLRDEFDELNHGLDTAAVWLALKDEQLLEQCLSALHVDQGLNKRSWKGFLVRTMTGHALSFGQAQLSKFETLVSDAILRCPSFAHPGKLATHHFRRTLFPEHTHSRRVLEQVTVFAEARFIADDAFVDSRVTTQVRRKVDSISVIFDQERSELDVVTLGGKVFIEEVANAFFRSFSDQKPTLESLLRRKVNFDRLLKKPDLSLVDRSRYEHAKIDEIRVISPGGSLYTFEARSHREGAQDVYDLAKTDFGEQSPFEKAGWKVVSARVLLRMPPSKPGRSPRFRTVELKPNGQTNLREQEDADLYIADELLVEWGILERRDSGDE